VQVCSRTAENAQLLAAQLDCDFTADLKSLRNGADFYLFTVNDDSLTDVISNMPHLDGVMVHTAGSVSIDVFKNFAPQYGVLYPLQTLSKYRKADFTAIPLFVEGCDFPTEQKLMALASSISHNVTVLPSEQRRFLHLAAVFANNFSNHLFTLASQILEKQGIDPIALIPLIDETAAKLHSMTPAQAQTGPAIRNDSKTMQRHLALLDNDLAKIYSLLSNSIIHNDKIRFKED